MFGIYLVDLREMRGRVVITHVCKQWAGRISEHCIVSSVSVARKSHWLGCHPLQICLADIVWWNLTGCTQHIYLKVLMKSALRSCQRYSHFVITHVWQICMFLFSIISLYHKIPFGTKAKQDNLKKNVVQRLKIFKHC